MMRARKQTIRERLELAETRVRDLESASWKPEIFVHGPYNISAWRDPFGINYRIHGPGFGNCISTGHDDSVSGTMRYARRHLAQATADATALDPSDIEGLRDFRSYSAWQAGYKVCRDTGADDAACRAFADSHQREFLQAKEA